MDINELTYEIIGATYKVHTELGPGLLESTYETCLEFELLEAGFKVESQKELPIVYREMRMEKAYRVDLLVEDLIILELKSVQHILPVHKAQLITYLKLSDMNLGLLLNFNVARMKDGITRLIV